MSHINVNNVRDIIQESRDSGIKPDLHRANLSNVDLSGIDLSGVEIGQSD